MANKKGILPGIFTALHTFGRDLKWNVHIHLSVTCGGLLEDLSQWKAIYFVKKQIMPMWRYELIDLLRQSYDSLILPEALKQQCATQQQWNQWLERDRDEWVKVQDGLQTKTLMEMGKAEGVESGIVLIKASIQSWSFMDGDTPVPVTPENIEAMQVEIILHIINTMTPKLPLGNTANEPTMEEPQTLPSGLRS